MEYYHLTNGRAAVNTTKQPFGPSLYAREQGLLRAASGAGDSICSLKIPTAAPLLKWLPLRFAL